MNAETKIKLANELIGRSLPAIVRLADVIATSPYSEDEGKLIRLTEMLEAIACHLIDEHGPDKNWFRQYFLVTGQHMVLTEEGWIPAPINAIEDPMEVLDEVNAPAEAT